MATPHRPVDEIHVSGKMEPGKVATKPSLTRADASALLRVRRAVLQRQGEGNFTTGEPDCMYWLKHGEAALIIGTLVGNQDPLVRPLAQKLAARLARAWNKYEAQAFAAVQFPAPPQAPREGAQGQPNEVL